ncbi:MAG: Sirohydrochlorin cobaltochelatase [Gemmatimonadetes bacterium]|nr:Sirohydrochlorin cobaltochelatase [Gemmatimonadota bacterium]
MLGCVSNLVQHLVGDAAIVRHAHMELAEPSIESGFAACVAAGATEVVVFPYMLSPGKHVTGDIPRLVAEAASHHPQATYVVTPAFGVHEKLGEIVLERAGLRVTNPVSSGDACQCWASDRSASRCGNACPVNSRAPIAPTANTH